MIKQKQITDIRKILYLYRGQVKDTDINKIINLVDSQEQKIAQARKAAEDFRKYHYESSGQTGICPEHIFSWESK